MLSRRSFLSTLGAAGAGAVCVPQLFAAERPATPRKKLAVITTEWRYHSHAWHMAERFLVGYPLEGRWHHPPFEVVSAYVDQFPENDLSRKRSEEFGFPIYKSVAEACDATIKVVSSSETEPAAKKTYNAAYPIYGQLYRSLKKDYETIARFVAGE